MFEAGKLYRHENSLDLDIRVCATPEDMGDKVNLRVMYWHRNYEKLMTTIDGSIIVNNVHVYKDKYPAWKEVMDQ